MGVCPDFLLENLCMKKIEEPEKAEIFLSCYCFENYIFL